MLINCNNDNPSEKEKKGKVCRTTPFMDSGQMMLILATTKQFDFQTSSPLQSPVLCESRFVISELLPWRTTPDWLRVESPWTTPHDAKLQLWKALMYWMYWHPSLRESGTYAAEPTRRGFSPTHDHAYRSLSRRLPAVSTTQESISEKTAKLGRITVNQIKNINVPLACASCRPDLVYTELQQHFRTSKCEHKCKR